MMSYAERDALILANLDLPHRVARYGAGLGFPEALEQESAGFIGLIRAAENWLLHREGEFRSYAWMPVRWAILEAVRDGGRPFGTCVTNSIDLAQLPLTECADDDWSRYAVLLSETQREVVYCRIILGLSQGETAARLGVWKRAVSGAEATALMRLRQHIGLEKGRRKYRRKNK